VWRTGGPALLAGPFAMKGALADSQPSDRENRDARTWVEDELRGQFQRFADEVWQRLEFVNETLIASSRFGASHVLLTECDNVFSGTELNLHKRPP